MFYTHHSRFNRPKAYRRNHSFPVAIAVALLLLTPGWDVEPAKAAPTPPFTLHPELLVDYNSRWRTHVEVGYRSQTVVFVDDTPDTPTPPYDDRRSRLFWWNPCQMEEIPLPAEVSGFEGTFTWHGWRDTTRSDDGLLAYGVVLGRLQSPTGSLRWGLYLIQIDLTEAPPEITLVSNIVNSVAGSEAFGPYDHAAVDTGFDSQTPFVVFSGTNDDLNAIFFARFETPKIWNIDMIVQHAPPARNPLNVEGLALAVDDPNKPWIAYWERYSASPSPNLDLYLGTYDPSVTDWVFDRVVTGVAQVDNYPPQGDTYDHDGSPVFAWAEAPVAETGPYTYKMRVATRNTDDTGWEIEDLLTDDSLAAHPELWDDVRSFDMETDPYNRTHFILYTSSVNGGLYYVRDMGQFQTVMPVGIAGPELGQNPSLGVDHNMRVTIACNYNTLGENPTVLIHPNYSSDWDNDGVNYLQELAFGFDRSGRKLQRLPKWNVMYETVDPPGRLVVDYTRISGGTPLATLGGDPPYRSEYQVGCLLYALRVSIDMSGLDIFLHNGAIITDWNPDGTENVRLITPYYDDERSFFFDIQTRLLEDLDD